jgi:hypothetical protein
MRLSRIVRHVAAGSFVLFSVWHWAWAGAVAAAEPATKSSGPTKSSAATSPSDEAASLVRQALAAEAEGNADGRDEYLLKAVAADPDYAPAHWQAGEVKVGDQWLPVDTAAAQNEWSEKFNEYWRLRSRSPNTADAHLKLAHWCEGAGLKDQQRMHLSAALQTRPSKAQQRDALGKLGMVRYRKTLMPAATAEALKKQAKETELALQHWKPLLTRLRNDLESRDHQRHAAAAEDLKLIQDPSAIQALETVFAKATPEAGKVAIAALAGMKQQQATDSLVRHAVLARHEEVRKAAAEALKERDLFTYVPLLLGGMNTPIEVNFQFFNNASGAFGERLSLYREGPLYNTSINSGLTALPNFTPQPGVAMLPLTGNAEAAVARQAAADSQVAVAALEENARTEMLNERIGSVLRVATGNDELGDDAKDWWDWWTSYNETHWASDKPTYETNRDSYMYYSATYAPTLGYSQRPTYRPPPSAPTPAPSYPTAYSPKFVLPPGVHWDRGQFACFVPGTLVWTVTGKVPIEKVDVGDWVLAQDVNTGELTYKPVSITTVGPPLPLAEIHVGGETIRATLGHLFWVSGTGWRMAKELKAGDRLHTTKGTLVVESVEQTGEAACHNLIVPDFNTYFVTDQQILVHDISVRGPTTATVPGLVEQ